jgi:hypothetical protein
MELFSRDLVFDVDRLWEFKTNPHVSNQIIFPENFGIGDFRCHSLSLESKINYINDNFGRYHTMVGNITNELNVTLDGHSNWYAIFSGMQYERFDIGVVNHGRRIICRGCIITSFHMNDDWSCSLTLSLDRVEYI